MVVSLDSPYMHSYSSTVFTLGNLCESRPGRSLAGMCLVQAPNPVTSLATTSIQIRRAWCEPRKINKFKFKKKKKKKLAFLSGIEIFYSEIQPLMPNKFFFPLRDLKSTSYSKPAS